MQERNEAYDTLPFVFSTSDFNPKRNKKFSQGMQTDRKHDDEMDPAGPRVIELRDDDEPSPRRSFY